jgi:hypothetical protein
LIMWIRLLSVSVRCVRVVGGMFNEPVLLSSY